MVRIHSGAFSSSELQLAHLDADDIYVAFLPRTCHPPRRSILLVMVVLVLTTIVASPGYAAGWYEHQVIGADPAHQRPVAPVEITWDDSGIWVSAFGLHHYAPSGQQLGYVSRTELAPTYTPTQGLATGPSGTHWLAVNRIPLRLYHFGQDMTVLGSIPIAQGSADNQIQSFSEIAVTQAGTVWVADNSNRRVKHFNTDGTLIRSVGTTGTGPGQFGDVRGIDVASDNSIWVVDYHNRVQHLSEDGTYLGGWGSMGTAPGQFKSPIGIQLSNDESLLAVTEATGARVQIFETDGTHVRTLGGFGMGEHELFGPRSAAISPDNTRVAVGDYDKHAVKIFDISTGLVIQTIGGEQNSVPGQLPRVKDVNILDDGDVGVALDSGAGPGLVLNADGTQQMAVGKIGDGRVTGFIDKPGAIEESSNGQLWVTSAFNGHRINRHAADGTFVSELGQSGTANGRFLTPVGIRKAPDNTMWVVDSGNHRLQQFDVNGTHLRTIGGTASGAGLGQFNSPQHITFAPDGRFWVTENGNDRIQSFAANGTPLGFLLAGQILTPAGIAFGPDGVIVVADRSTDRILRVSQAGTILDTLGTSANFTDPIGVDVTADGRILASDFYYFGIHDWRYDDSPPTVSASSAASDSSSAVVTVTATDQGSGLATEPYSFDGGATWQSSNTYTATGMGSGESRTLQVRVRDAMDNESANQAVTATAQTPPPVVTAPPPVCTDKPTVNPSGRAAPVVGPDGKIRFDWSTPCGMHQATATAGNANIKVSADGTLDLSRLSEGRHTIELRILDDAGNIGTWKKTVVVDRTAPLAVVPAGGFVLGPNVSMRVSDALSQSTTSRVRIRIGRLGKATHKVRLTDTAGNSARRSIAIERRPSLATPQLNSDLPRAWRGDAINDVFKFRYATEPWYKHDSSLSPRLVREVQWRLKTMGYFPPQLHSTGRLDPATLRAIRRYQRARNITPIATVGPLTRAALDKDLLRGLPRS